MNGKIYTVGGFVASVHKDGQPHVLEYDPATDSWRALKPLKSGLGSVAVAVLDGKIHAVGGRFGASSDKTDMHDIYDPATDSWSAGPPLPTARSGLAYTSYQGLVLVLGGELAPKAFAENEAYDPKSKSWLALAPMPAGRHGTAAATSGGHVYIAAGSLKPGSGHITDQLIVFTLPGENFLTAG